MASPLFDNIRHTSTRLGNSNNKQGFIILKRDVVAGEELRWKYNCAQTHRDNPAPPSPTAILPSPIFPTRRAASAAALASFDRCKRPSQNQEPPATFAAAATTAAIPATTAAPAKTAARKLTAVPHECIHYTTCNPGKCSDCECLECIQARPGVGSKRSCRKPFMPDE